MHRPSATRPGTSTTDGDHTVTTTFIAIRALVMVYLIVAVATTEAWTHAVIVCAFAVLLIGVTARAATGDRRAYRRLRVISVVIPTVSVVLILIPGLFPTWMDVEQAGYAVLLLIVAALANRRALRSALTDRP